MTTVDYDDSEALNEYVSHNLRELMTPAERREFDLTLSWGTAEIGKLKHADPKTFSKTQQAMFQQIRSAFDSLNEHIRQRIYRDIRSGELEINKCPSCSRIVRTPLAKQCLWCGHDWHNT